MGKINVGRRQYFDITFFWPFGGALHFTGWCLPTLLVLSALLGGCAPLLRSARIEDGTSVALIGGFPKQTENIGFYGQLEIRRGRSATETHWGRSTGVVIPWYFPGASVEVYGEAPRWQKWIATGFGGQIGLMPGFFHVISVVDRGNQKKPGGAEFFFSHRLLVGPFLDAGKRRFWSYDVTVGVAVPLGPHVTAQLGYNHFFIPGQFVFGSGDDSESLGRDINVFCGAFSFHHRRKK